MGGMGYQETPLTLIELTLFIGVAPRFAPFAKKARFGL